MLAVLTAIALAQSDAAPPETAVLPHFSAGSYGRVQASTNLAGGGGSALNLVHHGPRLEQDPYLELDLGWSATLDDGATFDVVVTPALHGDLLHYDGKFGDDLSLQNLYVETDHFVKNTPLAIWAGSRMYRGDDMYLLDFWPLDRLDAYGGGVRWHPGGTEVAAHVGVNRLFGEDWQVEELRVATPDSVSGETVLVLDRQRTIASLRLGQEVGLGKFTFRARLYGELHHLPAGTRIVADPFEELVPGVLPRDQGSLVGAELSLGGWAPQSFVNLWVRRSTGLAAFGELAIPVDGLALDGRTATARSTMVAVAANQETDHAGVMAGGYVSYDVDADGIAIDFDDRWEVVGVVRPTVYLTDHVAIAAEASTQYVRPNGLNPRSGSFDRPQVTKLSVLPGIQTARGGFARPRLQLNYTATFLDDDARRFFSPFDVRVREGVQQFVGIGAEWWLNSRRTITPTTSRTDLDQGGKSVPIHRP